ncbi:MAG: sulfotransferase domain-containing protein [Rhodospirillales bacterium]
MIATYPKCGTTWTQTIVGLLVFEDPEPRPILDLSPWIDHPGPEAIAGVLERLERQDHRRFLKSHLPLDGLPLFDEIKYIHVARDGRDASLSFHHHEMGLSAETLAETDWIGLEDETLGLPYPRMPSDPADGFHRWLTQGLPPDTDGLPYMSFFGFERSWWDGRRLPNVLLVHYNDLKADLAGEMRRIAYFLEIEIAESLWPRLVEAAEFQTMRKHGDRLMGSVAQAFDGGGGYFFNKGRNGRWQGLFRQEDLARYQALLAERLPPECARWVTHGRLGGIAGL